MCNLLTQVIFLPLLGALLILLIPSRFKQLIRGLALLVAFAGLALSFGLYTGYQNHIAQPSTVEAGFAFVQSIPWIEYLDVYYKVGIDGISLLLILLTTFTLPWVIIFSTGSIHEKEKSYYVCILLLQTAMLGTFAALDMFLFYVFWEAMLIPMYFLIGIWGGKRRIYAALKFFIYTMVGSVLMLAAIIYLYYQAQGSFDYEAWWQQSLKLAPQVQMILFAAFALSFAIKVPMFPLHTWLPDAHVEAPTAGSVILAGILLKMGTYGFVRFAMPFFPEAVVYAKPLLALLATIGIVYGALVSIVQQDVKKLVAYSSVSHLGFVMLGLMALTQQSVQGAIYQMLNHGITTGALFLLVGMLYDRRHTRQIADFGGIAQRMPWFTVFFLIVTFSAIALPGTNGFVGEFLILMGSYSSYPVLVIISTTAVILGAVYMLWMVQRVFFGKIENPENEKLEDIRWREILVIMPFIVMIFWMGIYPKPFFALMEGPVALFVQRVTQSIPAGVQLLGMK